MRKASPLLIVLVTATFGCASGTRNQTPSVPVPEGSPIEGSPIPPTAVKEGKTWRIVPSSSTDSYVSTIKASIKQEGAATPRTDRVTTVTSYSLTSNRSQSEISFSGAVTAFKIDDGDVGQAPDISASIFPVEFNGNISNHNLSITKTGQSPSQISCADSLQTVLSAVSKNIVAIPLELFSNQTWQDSTAVTLCSGSLPLLVSTVRSYRVGTEGSFNGVTALILERNEKILASGQGSQGQHQVTIESHGTGSGQIYVDPSTGALLGIRSRSQTLVSINTSGRTQTFIQTSEEVTDRRD